ncbi:MAG: LrgB family protein [Bacteroidaceae bacterium]|nr:LrgB family protein [Bacteroidaceae bacterium]
MKNELHTFLTESVYMGVMLTLGTYSIGLWLKSKTGWALMNPLLVAVVLTICFLCVTGMSYTSYVRGADVISYMLTPATICLAVPLYEQIEQLKRNFRAVVIGIAAGVLASMASILALIVLLNMDHVSYVTLLPKSITTAIGMCVSEELGGSVPVTIMVIVITGITGNIFAERFLHMIKVREPIAKGIAIGSASHVIGTAKAMEMGGTEGAMSSLSIVTSGVLTVIAASVFASLA